MFNYRRLALSALAFSSISWGHLDSLYLDGVLEGTKTASIQVADTFSIAESIPITFAMKVVHNGTTIYFRVSRDNGTTWTPITSSTAMNAVGNHTYTWVVTGPATSQGLIRVFHSASPNPEGMVPNDYTLISGRFTIVTASSLRPADFSKSLSFRQTPNSILVGYSGVSTQGLRLEINDLTGAVLRELPLLNLGGEEAAIPTQSLPQGRIFLRVLDGESSVANRAVMIRR